MKLTHQQHTELHHFERGRASAFAESAAYLLNAKTTLFDASTLFAKKAHEKPHRIPQHKKESAHEPKDPQP